VNGTTVDPATREYVLENGSIGAGGVLKVKLNKAAEALVVSTPSSGLKFNLKIEQSNLKTGVLETVVNKPLNLIPNQNLNLNLNVKK
jgi:hypothetical protein